MLNWILTLLTATSVPIADRALSPRIDLLVVDLRITDRAPIHEGACKLLRLRCDVTPGTLASIPEPGQIAVVLTDVGPLEFGGTLALGVTMGSGTCYPALWSDSDATVLAHELGHALGLEHVEGEDSLMYPIALGGDDLSRAERRAIRKGARNLRKC